MVLPIIHGNAAAAAIEGLALEHPQLANHIRDLGTAFLRKAVGLRDGRNGASKTYDLSFINSRHSFACLTATPGKYDNATEGRLQVQVRYQGDLELQVFKLKSTASEIARGWHATQVAGGDHVAPLHHDLLIALAN